MVGARLDPDAALVRNEIVDPLPVISRDLLVARAMRDEHRRGDFADPLIDRICVVDQQADRQVWIAIVADRRCRIERRLEKERVGLALARHVG